MKMNDYKRLNLNLKYVTWWKVKMEQVVFFFVFVLFMFCCYRVWENEEVEKFESKKNRLTIEKKKNK